VVLLGRGSSFPLPPRKARDTHAEKRCANFDTCESGSTGLSNVNKELLADFTKGEAYLMDGNCSAVRPIVDTIIKQMTVPLVQGSLRYAYKVGESISGEAKVGTDRSQKNAAEGAVFTAAVLPLVHECNVAAAKTISDEMKFGLYDQGDYPDFAAVKAAFESTYDCLGITCADVGGLSPGGVAAACDGAPSCLPDDELDYDADGEFRLADATFLAQVWANQSSFTNPSPGVTKLPPCNGGDFNGDGDVRLLDAVLLAQYWALNNPNSRRRATANEWSGDSPGRSLASTSTHGTIVGRKDGQKMQLFAYSSTPWTTVEVAFADGEIESVAAENGLTAIIHANKKQVGIGDLSGSGATHPSGLAMTVTFSPDTDMDSVRIDFSSEVTAIVHAIAQVQDVGPGPAGLLFH